MTGRYKAYTEYKDSDVDWLHDIPTHWKTIPVGRCYRRVKRTGFEKEELLSVYRDHGVVPKSSRDDNNNKPSDDLSPYQLVCENNLVMNKMKAWQGSIAISEFRGIVSPAYFVYEPMSHIDSLVYPKYVHYLLRHPIYITQYMSRSKGIRVNQWDLDPEEFQRIELLLPQIEEQKAIISFLDHETAKIDTLITKQEKLIELLKEKRQAVISHAVTKGLNPDAPMKNSGVEWLGEVPEHWAVGSLRWRISISSGEGLPSTLVEKNSSELKQVPVIGGNGVMGFTETSNTNRTAIAIGRVGALCGNVHLINYVSWITDNALKISSWDGFDEYYLVNLLKAANLNDLASKTAQPLITGEQIKSLTVVIPPIEEQVNINLKLTEITNRFDKLEQKSVLGIELLKERKTAIISAAVTGKIDVRDWKPAENSLVEVA
ncbi:restriction endonuclease subunit S [Vibrio alginolyticus]|uniref:restriction endonuclease subunit S n=1 Tax=Vibrio alginolyticus TaxID=663 RepID=UPI001BD6C67E|nr:restriction endonuclease subunit S [Vibrio alginolyticus]MBS9857488.1 restriction endonuclease subunit S [Vibrio alginolyticus]MCS0084358.1 restriction endonuclease subunit S [Vibrio alginolyticus]